MHLESETITPMPPTGQSGDHQQRALLSLAGPLLGFLRHYVGDAQLAEDLAQESLSQALTALPGLRDRSRLKPWLFRIAVNRFNDHLRRRRPVDGEEAERALAGRSGGIRPEREALTRELDAVLREELERLPERQRTVLMLHGLEGLDQPAIARLLGISSAAVKMSLHHARERMRERLARYLGRPLSRRGGWS